MAYLTAADIEEIKKKKKKKQSSVNTPKYLTNKDIEEILNRKNNVNVAPIKREVPTKKSSAVGTAGRILTGVGTGFLKGSEAIADAMQYGAANVAGWVGADKAKKALIENAKYNSTKVLTGNAEKFYDPIAYKPFKTGGIGNSIAEGVGQVGSMIGTVGLLGGVSKGSKLAKTAKTLLPSAIQGYGSGVTTGLEKGNSFNKSQAYGLGNAVVQAGSEGLFGGIGGVLGKGALDDIVVKSVTNRIKSNLGKNITRIGIKSAGEGLEENIAGVLDPILQKMTIDKNAQGYFTDENGKFTLNKAGQDFLVGAATSALLQSPSITRKNIETKQDNKNQQLENNMRTNVQDNVSILEKQENVLDEPKIANNKIIMPIKENIIKDIPVAEDIIRIRKENKITNKYNKMLEEDLKVASKEADKILYFDTTEQRNNFKELLNNYVKSNEIVSHEQLKTDIISNFKEKVVKNIDSYLKEVKKDVRSYKIKVSDDIKRSITDYNDFKKSNFGKLKLTNDGQAVDGIYQELSEAYPDIFSKDIINSDEQLQRLSEVMNENIETFEKYNLDEDTIDKATKYVENFLNNEEDLNTLIENIEVSPKEIRKEKVNQYRKLARINIGSILTWKDKKFGLGYKINTAERNFRSIAENPQAAEQIIKVYVTPITESNANIERFINKFNERIIELKLSNKESIAVQMLGEYKYNPETELTSDQVESYIKNNNLNREKILKSIEVFRTIYDETLPQANKILREQGYKEIPYRKGYFPHFTETKQSSIIGKMAEKLGWKFNDTRLPTDIAGMTDIFKPGKTWFRHALQRKGDATSYNAVEGFDNYIRGIADIIYHTENIQKLRALENEIRYEFSDKGIKEEIDLIYKNDFYDAQEKQAQIDLVFEKIDNHQMPNLVSWLRNYTNSLANKKDIGDRQIEADINRNIYNTITNIDSRLRANMIGGNIRSALTNFIPLTQAWSQISTKNMLKATSQTIVSCKQDDGFADKSTFLTNRTKQADRLYKTTLDKTGDTLGIMFEGIDHLTANIIVRGKYLENIDKGMTETQAIENADRFAKDVIGGRDKGSQPTIFNRKHPVIRLFTAFQLEVNNQYGYMFKDLPNDLKDEGIGKLTTAFMKMFFAAWLYNQFMEKVTGSKTAFSPVDLIQESIETIQNESIPASDKVTNIGKNLIQEAPFIGGFVGGGRLPINAAIPYNNPFSAVTTSIENGIKAFDADPDKKETALNSLKKEWSKPIYYVVAPFGGGQLKKTVEGLSMYKNELPGSYTNSGQLRFPVKDDKLTKAQAAIFGQYASKDAREYFDKNRRPLSENQVEEVKNSKDWKEAYELILKQREYDALGRKYEKYVKEGKSTKELQKEIDNFWK